MFQFAEENFFGERLFKFLLNHSAHWARPEQAIEALSSQHLAGLFRQFESDLFLLQLSAQLLDELVDDSFDIVSRQLVEVHYAVQAVSKFRSEFALDRRFRLAGSHGALREVLAFNSAETNIFAGHFACPGVGGHDQDYLTKVGFLAVVVGEAGMVHNLQQYVEQVRVRLFNFIQNQHRMR